MIEYSSKEENALNSLIHRYMTWQKLLQYENKSVLSFQRQKGLLGELIYLSKMIDDIGTEAAVDSWAGPDGSDQDYLFQSEWAEIKCVSLASETVHISSLQQLQQEMEGNLVVYIIESTTAGDDRISLVDVVSEIKTKLENNARYLDRFDLKLYKYGYRKNHENEYRENQFRFIEEREYIVNDSFPKLVGNSVPSEIVSCKYELSLAAIEKYRR